MNIFQTVKFEVNDRNSLKSNMLTISSMIRNSQYALFSCGVSSGYGDHISGYYTFAKVISVKDPAFSFLLGNDPGVITLGFADGKRCSF